VYLEKILAASVNVIDLNISGWTLRMVPSLSSPLSVLSSLR
jgi:hypothetical protein